MFSKMEQVCKFVRLSSPIPWDLRHAEQLLFMFMLKPNCLQAIVFAHPLCASLSCLQYGISFGNKKTDNVDQDYIVLFSNLIEEGTVQCIVEQLDLATGNTAGQDGDTLVMR